MGSPATTTSRTSHRTKPPATRSPRRRLHKIAAPITTRVRRVLLGLIGTRDQFRRLLAQDLDIRSPKRRTSLARQWTRTTERRLTEKMLKTLLQCPPAQCRRVIVALSGLPDPPTNSLLRPWQEQTTHSMCMEQVLTRIGVPQQKPEASPAVRCR